MVAEQLTLLVQVGIVRISIITNVLIMAVFAWIEVVHPQIVLPGILKLVHSVEPAVPHALLSVELKELGAATTKPVTCQILLAWWPVLIIMADWVFVLNEMLTAALLLIILAVTGNVHLVVVYAKLYMTVP